MGKLNRQNPSSFMQLTFCMFLLMISPMPLSHKQLAAGVAYFTLLSQIEDRLEMEDAAKRKEPTQGKEPALQGESHSQKHDDFTP